VGASNDPEQARIGCRLIIGVLDQHSQFATDALQAYMTKAAFKGTPAVLTGNGVISRLVGDWGSGQQHVNFFVAVKTAPGLHVHELVAPPAQSQYPWADDDLTATTPGAIAAAPGSGLDRYWGMPGISTSITSTTTEMEIFTSFISRQ